MMKPLLQNTDINLDSPPPMRVLGLLERRMESYNNNQFWQKLVQYYRPLRQQPCLQAAQWSHFLHINNANDESCVAVFSYEFDGVQSWYHVWNSRAQRSVWISHHDDMIYQPYAIVAMNALVSLVPNWNGLLRASPTNDDSSNTTINSIHKYEDADRPCNVLVSDASADANGELWFLVTIKPTDFGESDMLESNTRETKTGWISLNLIR